MSSLQLQLLLLLLPLLASASAESRPHAHTHTGHRSQDSLRQLSARLHRSTSALELAAALASHDPAPFCDADMLRWFRRQARAGGSPTAMASFKNLKQVCRRIKIRRHPRRLLTPKHGSSSKVSPDQLVALYRRYTGLRCQPRRALVTLNVTQHDAVIFPNCVAVKRCAGCDCPGEGEHCAPTKKANVKRKVLSIGSRLLRNGTIKQSIHVKAVAVESHVECACICKVQPHDCSPWQLFDENSCSCRCRTAAHCHGPHHWNPHRCLCECRKPPSCSTGSHVDPASCACVLDQNNSVL